MFTIRFAALLLLGMTGYINHAISAQPDNNSTLCNAEMLMPAPKCLSEFNEILRISTFAPGIIPINKFFYLNSGNQQIVNRNNQCIKNDLELGQAGTDDCGKWKAMPYSIDNRFFGLLNENSKNCLAVDQNSKRIMLEPCDARDAANKLFYKLKVSQ